LAAHQVEEEVEAAERRSVLEVREEAGVQQTV
jgi:hypothetical protein